MEPSLAISLTALLVSVASFWRVNTASRREQLLRLEQRRQTISLALLRSEEAVRRSHDALQNHRPKHADLPRRYKDITGTTSAMLEDLKEMRTSIDGLDPFLVPPTETQVRLERVAGKATALEHRITEMEKINMNLLSAISRK